MFTSLVQILFYLSATFLLGLVLGWLLWKFGGSKELAAKDTNADFWQNRFEQSRVERSLEQDRFTILERERDNLKKRLKSIQSSQTE